MSLPDENALIYRETTENGLSRRGGLLQLVQSFLERNGFGNTAWDQKVSDRLCDAFDACIESELTPDFVFVKLMDILKSRQPTTDLDKLIAIIDEVTVAATEQDTPQIPAVYRMR